MSGVDMVGAVVDWLSSAKGDLGKSLLIACIILAVFAIGSAVVKAFAGFIRSRFL